MAFHCCTPEWGEYGHNDIRNMCGYCGSELCGWSWVQSGKEDTGRMDSGHYGCCRRCSRRAWYEYYTRLPGIRLYHGCGAVSGLAATGVNQMYKQANK